jgi:hypothetical protein
MNAVNVAIALLAALAGGAWRRWEGQAMTGFLAHRWVKLTVAAVFGLAVCWWWTRSPLVAVLVSAVLTAGWTPAAQFGRVDNDFTWPLLARYGGMTLVAALVAAVLSNDIHAMAYAPVGLFAPLGYTVGKWTVPTGCWTCVGEVWLGATIYGGLFLI